MQFCNWDAVGGNLEVAINTIPLQEWKLALRLEPQK